MAAVAPVMEMSGLYGPYTFHEHVLQRVWAEQEFDLRRARTTEGATVEVLNPGKWNRLGGPDFLGATLRIGGRVLTGDIEVHFHATDWEAHGHARNAAYSRVILHVVLFPPDVRQPGTQRLPTLVLLPLLLRDLEEIASDEALQRVTGRLEGAVWGDLRALSPDERRSRLQVLARDRWEQKRHFAALRVRQVGWDEAAHRTALEILGYRFNRAQMLSVAASHPLGEWRTVDVAARAFEEMAGRWQLQGLRPANHPRNRLRQYSAWVRTVPDWPARLRAMAGLADQSPAGTLLPVGETRRRLDVAGLRRRLARDIIGGAVAGGRLDNLVCDGLLPLMAARESSDGFATWFCWPLGDAPDALKAALRPLSLASGGKEPACHGWGQGLLAWLLQGRPHSTR